MAALTVATENIIVISAFLAALATALAIALPFMRSDPRKARLQAVTQRRQELSAEQRQNLNQQRSQRQPKAYVNVVKNVLTKLNLENLLASPKIRRNLAAAGWRQRWMVVTFVSVRFGVAFGLPPHPSRSQPRIPAPTQ